MLRTLVNLLENTHHTYFNGDGMLDCEREAVELSTFTQAKRVETLSNKNK